MPDISLETAQKAVNAAMVTVREKFAARPVCVSVCDASGFLLAFARMDGAPLRSIAIARQKAYTAVRMGGTTAAFGRRLKTEGLLAGDFCDDGLTPIPGGCPITGADGAILGGVGISGLKADEDDIVAVAAAESCMA